MVEVFMPAVRDRINNKVVKKTLTLPAWLNWEAEAANVNFSLILQDGLKRYLGKPQNSARRPGGVSSGPLQFAIQLYHKI